MSPQPREPRTMLDKGFRLIQQAADVKHGAGPVLKRQAQLRLDFC
jgi:hypothetical protein